MASTYSNLKIELIGTGDQSGTWGVTTNTNLGTAIEEAITGSADVAFSSSDVTLTLTNTNTTQTARNLRLNLTGISGGARNLIVPSIEKQYIINNGLADAVTVKNSTGTGVAVPAGKSMFVYNTGSNVVEVVTALATGTVIPIANGGTGSTSTTYCSLTTNVTGTLPVANGGTGTASLTANNIILGNGTSAVSFVAPGSAGNLLTSNGTTWVSTAAPTSFVSGMIILWSGSSASIPSGWLLCDGTSSTPDLRNRFIVGAGSTYAVGGTGGSADAIVVSHTHTATVTDPGHSHTIAITPITDSGNGNPPRMTNSGSTSTDTATTGISVGISTTGSSGTNANLPPYYALCYIMKS
jgi:hypothetical protein